MSNQLTGITARPTIDEVIGSSGTNIPDGGTTADTTVTLSGTADYAMAVVVEVFDAGESVGTSSVLPDRAWTLDVLGLNDGLHKFVAHISDGSQFSDEYRITVSTALDLPKPTVTQAPTGVLDPLQAVNGATVVVAYTGMLITDTIGLSWDGHNDLVPTQNGSTLGSVTFTIPASAVAAALGKTIQVIYAVVRNGVAKPSDILALTVQPLPQSALDKPTILQAANNGEGPELDVTALTANATLRVNDWPLIALGQYVWLRLAGTKTDGSTYSKTLWQPPTSKTNASWISQGYYDVQVPVAELKALKDASTLTVEFKATLDGSQVEGQAVTFPLRTYTIKVLEVVTPVEITSVTGAAGPVANGGSTYNTHLTITGRGTPNGRISIHDGTSTRGEFPISGSGSWTTTVLVFAVSAGQYSVTAKVVGEELTSDPWCFTVAEDQSFITPLLLNGTMIRDLNRPVVTPPAGTTATRTASWGVPPYIYTTDNPSIIELDSRSGRVVSYRSGFGRVFATDATGRSVSYPVTVSNAFRIYFGSFRLRYHSSAVAEATSAGGRLLTYPELQSYVATYNHAPGWGFAANEWVWSSTLSDDGAWAVMGTQSLVGATLGETGWGCVVAMIPI